MRDKELLQARNRWEEETLRPTLERAPERQERFETPSGIPLDRIYTPADVEVDYLQDLGFPGEYPFTRGVQPTMYRGRLWTMRQYAGYATAEESNARYSACRPTARRAFPSPLTSPPSWATTPTTPWPLARSARSVSPSAVWTICGSSLTASPWIRSAPP